ncbi:MAG: NUDIX domain-containing protein [Actinomycetota bacterium]
MSRREVMVHVRRGDEFLVLHRVEAKGGYWHTVAARVEHDEDWPEAARRELREEAALDGELRELGAFSYEPSMDGRAFAVDAPAGWEPTLDWEHDDYRWCSRADAAALLEWPEPKEMLRAV